MSMKSLRNDIGTLAALGMMILFVIGYARTVNLMPTRQIGLLRVEVTQVGNSLSKYRPGAYVLARTASGETGSFDLMPPPGVTPGDRLCALAAREFLKSGLTFWPRPEGDCAALAP